MRLRPAGLACAFLLVAFVASGALLVRSFFVADELEWRHFTTTPTAQFPLPAYSGYNGDFYIDLYASDRSVHAQTYAGRLVLWREDPPTPGAATPVPGLTSAPGPDTPPPGWSWRWHRSERGTTYWPGPWGHRQRVYEEAWYRIRDGNWWKAGFGCGTGAGKSWPPRKYAAVAIPLWPLVPLAAVAPAVSFYRRRRSARRAARGCCTACGYDLRASSGVCPECGQAVAGS